MADDHEAIIRLQEQLKVAQHTAARAHDRQDKHELYIRDEFTKLNVKIDALSKEMEPLNNWMNKGKGAVTALVFVSGGIGAAFMYLFNAMTGRP